MDNNIFYASDEAAKYRTDIKGWVSRDGKFWGDGDQAEHMARYTGSTHQMCMSCDTIIDKRCTRCTKCFEAIKDKQHRERKQLKWDMETPLYSEKLDRYFFESQDIENVMGESGFSWQELRLVICDPQKASHIEDDYFSDVMPEDGTDIPDAVQEAMAAFNRAIDESPPMSWTPGDYAATL